MARLKKPDYPFGVVVWDDAFQTNFDDEAHKVSHKPKRLYSPGWILKEDELGVSVASEWCPDDNTWRNVTFVPRGMLVEVRPVKSV